MKAVDRLKSNAETEPKEIAETTEPLFRIFNVNKRKVKIFLDEIIYIESLKDYVKIFTKERNWVTKFKVGELEKYLDDNNFLRIHRSFIVSKSKIKSITSSPKKKSRI